MANFVFVRRSVFLHRARSARATVVSQRECFGGPNQALFWPALLGARNVKISFLVGEEEQRINGSHEAVETWVAPSKFV